VSLAEEHFKRFFNDPVQVSYTSGEAEDILRGRPVRDEAKEFIYAKMLRLGSILVADSLKIGRDSSQLVIRSLPDGESSASAAEFADGSFFIGVSYALLDAITSVADMMVMFEHGVDSAQGAFTRRGRERQMQQTALELSASMRAWVIMQRVTDTAQGLAFNLSRADTIAAGEIALEALKFVLAHEIAHIALKHTQVAAESTIPVGHISQSQSRELQADNLAVRMVTGQRSDRATDAGPMWGVFLALLAMELTERAIYVRRNSTHPLAWARWAVVEQMLGGGQSRAKSYQLAILAGAVAALKLDEVFPGPGWAAMQQAQIIAAESMDLALLDQLVAGPIDQLAERAHATSSARGREILTLMRQGGIAAAMATLGAKERLVQAIAGDRWAVKFFTIKSLIESACTAEALNPDASLYSVVGTRMVARVLTEDTRGDPSP
jgi:Peptidase U49